MRYLYDVFVTCAENDCPDLMIALAMYRGDHPDRVDDAESKEMRMFIARHYEELVEAFEVRDPMLFDTVVERIIAAEKAAAEKKAAERAE